MPLTLNQHVSFSTYCWKLTCLTEVAGVAVEAEAGEPVGGEVGVRYRNVRVEPRSAYPAVLTLTVVDIVIVAGVKITNF